MKLELKRMFFKDTYTIGQLFVDGQYFCDTLEDVPRAVKVQNETCIPTGDYQVSIDFSNRFQRDMPHVLDVPGFDGIRIHSGNTDKDTDGCILVGQNKIKGEVINSRDTFNKLFPLMQNAIKEGEEISISIT